MAKFKVGDRVRFTDKVNDSWWFKAGQTGVITNDDKGDVYRYEVEVDGRGSNNLAFCDAEHIEHFAAAPAEPTPEPIHVTPGIDMNPIVPQVGDDVLIFGTIAGINHSPRGTNYNIVFETQNRRMSLHFLDEDFILFEDDGSGDCVRADNDNGTVPSTDTAKAFDAMGTWLRSLAVQRAA